MQRIVNIELVLNNRGRFVSTSFKLNALPVTVWSQQRLFCFNRPVTHMSTHPAFFSTTACRTTTAAHLSLTLFFTPVIIQRRSSISFFAVFLCHRNRFVAVVTETTFLPMIVKLKYSDDYSRSASVCSTRVLCLVLLWQTSAYPRRPVTAVGPLGGLLFHSTIYKPILVHFLSLSASLEFFPVPLVQEATPAALLAAKRTYPAIFLCSLGSGNSL